MTIAQEINLASQTFYMFPTTETMLVESGSWQVKLSSMVWIRAVEAKHCNNKSIRIKWLQNNFNDSFDGTSAAVLMVSVIIALAIEVNPNLPWRDVQHISKNFDIAIFFNTLFSWNWTEFIISR